MDGFRDIHPWPYHWSRDIAGHPISRLSAVEFVYDNLDFWTYDNHWSWPGLLTPTPPDHITDIYWSDDGEERLQLPPPIGDHVTDLLLLHSSADIRVMIWFNRIWQPLVGWTDYVGEQGGFVDHIHVEWKPED